MLGDIYNVKNVFNSKTFLPPVCKTSKDVDIVADEAPKLKGHVIVIGIGDTALDCARSAYR
jgi:NADPH-dependent glutamate synthase beta subunit-like oxidoreductase